ncbi:MAG: hypothetical protein ACI9N3_002260 [Colwellia sp.]|jgi:hypothetical protein
MPFFSSIVKPFTGLIYLITMNLPLYNNYHYWLLNNAGILPVIFGILNRLKTSLHLLVYNQ